MKKKTVLNNINYDMKLNKIYVREITAINENYYIAALKAENS